MITTQLYFFITTGHKITTEEHTVNTNLKVPKLLVVEDEPELISFVKSFLVGLGYEVVTATNGMEGLNLARQVEPSLIILDVNLPKLNGFAVSRLLKFDENFRHIPIILWTWREADKDREMGLYSGADCYLPKPFSVKGLQSAIEALIGPSPKSQEQDRQGE